MSATKAEIQITASTSMLAAGLRTASKMVQSFATGISSAMSSAHLAPKKDWMGHALGYIGGNLAVRGLDLLVAQGKEVMDFEEKLMRFGLAARKGGSELREVGKAARDTASATGINATEVLRGIRAYVDLAGAENYSAEKMSLIARSAQATGSDVGDMATVIYSLTNALHIGPTELEDTIGGIINQSKDGTVHFQQMAQEIIALAPIYARFGVTGREGAIQMAAQLQIVRSGFKDSAEAAVGLKNMWRNLQLHSDKFEKAGVKIFDVGADGHKKLRPIAQILTDISKAKLNFDPHALMKAFGRGESERAFRLLSEQVVKLHELEEAGKVNGTVQADLATVTESATGRMAVAFETLKNQIAQAFTPERVQAFVAAIENLGDSIKPLVEGVGELVDGLNWIYSKGKGLRGLFGSEDNNPFKVTADEAKYLKEHATAGLAPHDNVGPGDVARGKVLSQAEQRKFDEIRRRSADQAFYHTEAAELMRLQGGESGKPNDAAIKAAILAKRTNPTEIGALGTMTAADRYLSNVSPAKIKAAEAQIAKDQHVAALRAALDPLAEKIGREVHAAFERARAGDAHQQAVNMQRQMHANDKPVVVNIDGNPVAKASDNATSRRRK